MSDNLFKGATQDPIALLHQLISHVADVRRDLQGVKEDLQGVKEDLQGVKEDLQGVKEDLQGVKEDLKGVKADLAQFKQETNDRLDRLQSDVTALRGELGRAISNVDRDLAAHRESVDLSIERKVFVERERSRALWEERQEALERRIEELEAAERRRRESTGA